MIKRCIMIFPKFENGQIIDRIREQYDPLTNHVRPHMTLVFPFDSDIGAAEIKEHISSAIIGMPPFEVILHGITPVYHPRNYLFLNVQKGRDELVELHRRIYTGILQGYYPEWLKDKAFLPHMTVGLIDDEEAFKKAILATSQIDDSFRTTVDEIGVEIIDENEDSIMEMTVPLGNREVNRAWDT
jgi:2'-5' RNA ligase